MHTGENELVITAEPKSTYFDLPKDVGNNLKYETQWIFSRPYNRKWD